MKSIDDRMKDNYEKRNRHYLTRRTPVIIRIDGKAFHTYTKKLKKPFDEGLVEDMQLTTKYLCENIQGCKFGYVQSDEISLLLTDYDTLQTDAWFDYCQNKMESISASMTTGIFNKMRLYRYLSEGISEHFTKDFDVESYRIAICDIVNYFPISDIVANFDSRAFNIPKEEVCNYFIWRQQDATKNSISMLAQSLYSHVELQGKNGNQMQEMCWQKGINWDLLPSSWKRGTAVYKKTVRKDLTDKVKLESLKENENAWRQFSDVERWGIYIDEWFVDHDTPIFSQNRDLIGDLI